MSHTIEINHSEIPIRLFKSDFLEFFTHIHPAVVVVIWLPVILFFLINPIVTYTGATFPWYIPAGFIIGLVVWSFTEYNLHRFIFHFPPRTQTMERITFLFHGVHHAQPQCKTRLVMPPIVSIPLAVIFYGLFYLVIGVLFGAPQWVHPLLAGFSMGYLTYDLAHYATHHFAMRSGYLKFLKRYHMQHHYKTPNQRFGVSSPLWDFVYGTYPK